MKKKLLAIILSAALVCAMLPFAMFSAFAAGIADSGTFGENNSIAWELDEAGVLTISGTGAMPDYEWPWDNGDNPRVTMLIIGSGVTYISTVIRSESLQEISVDSGNQVYSSQNGVLYNKAGTTLIRCPGAKSGAFTIPTGVTTIGDYAFGYCRSLTSITIPNTVTSIGEESFQACRGLTSIEIPASVESIGEDAFEKTSEIDVTILSSDVVIGDWAFDDDVTIYGYSGSSAETYANNNDITFISLDGGSQPQQQGSEEPEEPAAASGPSLAAIYELLNDGMTNPAETFTFTIAKVSVSDSDNYTYANMPMFNPATYTISFANGEATLAGDSNAAALTLPTYEHVGIFTYTITQTAGTTAGVTYDDTVIYMVISATQGANGIETTVAMHYGLNGEKTEFLTNTYSAGNLAITGETTGNLSDLDKEFDVTVTFTREAGKTGDLVIGYIEDGVEYTVEGENGVYEAEIHIKNGETITFTNIPYGTTYTVVEDDYTGEGYDAAVYSVEDIETDGATMGAAANPLTITNNKEVSIDTGVLLSSMPYAIALSGMIGAAVIVLLAKKKRKEVEEN